MRLHCAHNNAHFLVGIFMRVHLCTLCIIHSVYTNLHMCRNVQHDALCRFSAAGKDTKNAHELHSARLNDALQFQPDFLHFCVRRDGCQLDHVATYAKVKKIGLKL